MTRTAQQNRALHKYFSDIAYELNARNLGVTVVLKPDTQWSSDGVKELLWKPVQKIVQEVVHGKEPRSKVSTAKLESDEVSEIYDVMNKVLSERFDIHIPFPHIEKEF